MLAMHLRGDAFTAEEKARNFAYYEARTVRDSSLSAAPRPSSRRRSDISTSPTTTGPRRRSPTSSTCTTTPAAGSTSPPCRGTWAVAVAGFGGMRDHDGRLTFAPRLPPKLSRLVFRMRFAGRLVEVEARRHASSDRIDDLEVIAAGEQRVTYRLLEGESFVTQHHGQPVELAAGASVTLEVPPLTAVGPVSQPPGRAPVTRTPSR